MMCQHFVEATGWLAHRNGTGIGFVWLCMRGGTDPSVPKVP